MGQVMHLEYESSLSQICAINSSFDKAKLRIAYTGKNRNGSYISKQTFIDYLNTIYNCPVVCNYNRAEDSIGGHDIELVVKDNGDMRLVNVTTPVGVVPESASPYFETVIEDDGTEHEYLCTDILLWRRQEAYDKICRDGTVSESMEITVKDGHQDKDLGAFVIESFEFTAFCLLGDDIPPCFESASVEMYSHSQFKAQMEQMMSDLRETFTMVNSPEQEIDIHSENSVKGGKVLSEEKNALIAEYGINIDELDFSVDELSVDELREKFEQMKTVEASHAESDEPAVEHGENFALEGQFREELIEAIEGAETIEMWYGECPKYWFHDYDTEVMEVYAFDCEDWKLYGFTFSMNGDVPVIDFASKKRMKFAVVPFDEGEQAEPFATAFTKAEEQFNACVSEWSEKYQTAAQEITGMKDELDTLRQFKADTEKAQQDAARMVELEEVFADFEDLAGVEEFEALRDNNSDMAADEVREKCYAIRGKRMPVKFAFEQKSTKIIVDKTTAMDEPYGGAFVRYGNR